MTCSSLQTYLCVVRKVKSAFFKFYTDNDDPYGVVWVCRTTGGVTSTKYREECFFCEEVQALNILRVWATSWERHWRNAELPWLQDGEVRTTAGAVDRKLNAWCTSRVLNAGDDYPLVIEKEMNGSLCRRVIDPWTRESEGFIWKR